MKNTPAALKTSEKITRTIHPAIAEQLAELEAAGFDMETVIRIAHATLSTLACTKLSVEGRKDHAYAAGRMDITAQIVDMARDADHRKHLLRDWRIAQFPGAAPQVQLITERRDQIEAQISNYKQYFATKQEG